MVIADIDYVFWLRLFLAILKTPFFYSNIPPSSSSKFASSSSPHNLKFFCCMCYCLVKTPKSTVLNNPRNVTAGTFVWLH